MDFACNDIKYIKVVKKPKFNVHVNNIKNLMNIVNFNYIKATNEVKIIIDAKFIKLVTSISWKLSLLRFAYLSRKTCI